jgi:hypothetical protein
MGWFSKLFGGQTDARGDGFGLTATQRSIAADLAHAARPGTDVAERLLRYVYTGEGEADLPALAKQMDRAFPRLANHAKDSTKAAAVTGRALFFYRNAGVDVGLTLRYLRVLHLGATAHPGLNDYSPVFKAQTPAVQMLFLALQNAMVTDKAVPDEPLPPEGLTRSTLLILARQLRASEDDLLRAMVLMGGPLLWPVETFPLAVRLAREMGLERDYRDRTAQVLAHHAALGHSGGDISQTVGKLGLKDHPVYLSYMGDSLTVSDRAKRKAAEKALSFLAVDTRERLVIERLDHPDAAVREDLATWLAGLGTPGAEAALDARLKVEKSGGVRRVIEAHFAGRAMQTEAAVPDDDTGYTAIGGARIAIPPMPDFIPGERPLFGANERAELMALIEADHARRQAQYEEWIRRKVTWRPSVPTMIETVQADYLIARLNGEKPDPRPPYCSVFSSLLRASGSKWYRRQLLRLPQEIGLREFGGSALEHLSFHRDEAATLQAYLQAPNMDLRRIEQLMAEMKGAAWPKGKTLATLIGSNDRYSRQDRSREFAHAATWPLLAANLHVIEDAFSTAPKVFKTQSRRNSITWLKLLPATPQRFLAPLLAIATSPKRESRAEARALLADAPGIDDHLIGLLQDAKADTRRVAAEWLAERRAAGAEAALRARLKSEKTEAVRAAMITALARIGADIAAYAGPKVLLAEAEAGMKGGDAPPDWLRLDSLGALRWRDGAPLPEVVLHWWIKLAIKLKQPGGNGMLSLYLDQMHPEDRVALGRLTFDGWVAESLVTVTETNPWMGAREVLSNTSSETKGILALAHGVPSVHAAGKTRWYLKTHGQQTSQTSALLELLAAKADPPSLQVVLAAANRLKQKGVQKLAGDLVARIAEDNDWTLDQLADRSVPTLGLEEGRLDLPCGAEGKVYFARLDEAMDLVLFNPEGKPIKALPAGEDEATRESKATFADAKKTLSQALSIQRERLVDAMCSGRVWPAGEWLGSIHAHPVLRKAAEQLVWLGVDAEGGLQAAFRPTPEGDFIGADDAAVSPGEFAGVRLAHSMLVGPAGDAAWARHLKDYEAKPLFPQFGRMTPGTLEPGAESVADRNGWITDTFTVRGLAKKLGYDRAAAEDGGHFGHYARRFPVAGLIATLNFSGNCLPEENMTAVIYDLRFARDQDGKPAGEVPPAKVPPVLLAECWHDYHVFASKGAFDPSWERLSPW